MASFAGNCNQKLLLLLSSQLVVAAFMFGNTCKTIFEAIVFVFVMHPFDVGDRCVVDGVQMNILTTVFLKLDNEKVYYPNSVLATKPISNSYRSPDIGQSLTNINSNSSTMKLTQSSLRMKTVKGCLQLYVFIPRVLRSVANSGFI
ncbi:hypothetical protein V6Z12_D10G284700 [Gossypium hirsutum]